MLGQTVDPEGAVKAGFLDRLDSKVDACAPEIAALSDAACCGTQIALWRTAIERIESLVAAQDAQRDAVR